MATTATGYATLYKLDPDALAAGTTVTTIAEQLDGKIEISLDVVERTSKDSSNIKHYIPHNVTWTGSLSGYLDASTSIDFDGSTELAYILDHADFDFTTAMSINCVFKPDSITGTQTLVDKYDGATDGWRLYLSGADLIFEINNSGTTDAVGTVAGVIQIGDCYRVYCSYSGAANAIKCYINGHEHTVVVTGTVPDACGVNATRVTIAADKDAANFFDGKIYSVLLGAVVNNATTPLAFDDCVAIWGFNQDLTDGSGNAHTLTGTNIAATDYGDDTQWALIEAMQTRVLVTMQLAEAGTSATYTGTCIITSVEHSHPQGGMAGYSASWQGTGALTPA